jgi:pyrroline-5-carboxylate reductase
LQRRFTRRNGISAAQQVFGRFAPSRHIISTDSLPRATSMKVGFIGYGNMGSTMVRSFLSSGALAPSQAIVASRRKEARDEIRGSFPGIEATDSNKHAARESNVLLLSVRSDEVRAVLDEIAGDLRPDAHVISVNDGVTLKDIGSIFSGKATKVMPPITMEVGRGVTLVCHNDKVREPDKAAVRSLFGRVSVVKEIPEGRFEVAGDLTSSAPAYVAAFIELFAEGACRSGGIGREEAVELATETLFATAGLMEAQKLDAATLVSKVATPGGITEQGVDVLEAEMPHVIDRLFRETGERHERAKEAVRRQFDA